MQMSMTLKLNLLQMHPTPAALCKRMVLVLAAIVALEGCGRVSDEQLAQAVETAMKRSTLRHKAEIVENLMNSTNTLAAQELERLNKAEEVYDTRAVFEVIPLHPWGYGSWFKIKRGFSSYEVVDLRESTSLLHKYEAVVEYKYVALRTKQYASAYDGAEEKAKKDFDFKEIGEEGSLELLYRFDANFEWDREEGELVRSKGWQVPVLPSVAAPPPISMMEIKAIKLPAPAGRNSGQQKRSISPSTKAPDAKRSSDESVGQPAKKSPADTAEN